MLGTDERILAELRDLKEQVKRLADAMQKQQDRRSYQKDYYKRRKAAKKAVPKSGLLNRDGHCLDVNRGRDSRLPVAEWAQVLRLFAEKGASSYNFLTWLSWAWNHDTYQHQPITRSGVLPGLHWAQRTQGATEQVRREGAVWERQTHQVYQQSAARTLRRRSVVDVGVRGARSRG